MTPLTDAPGAKKSADQTAGHFWESLAISAASDPDAVKVLDRSMEILASLYGADRTWLGRYNSAWTHFWGVSDWVASGVVSHLQEMQGVSVDTIFQAHQAFLRGQNVLIPDVDRLPRQARSLQAELRRESVRSTLAVPVFHEGTLTGFFGFDYVGKLAAWTSSDLERLPAVANFLGALLHRASTISSPEESGKVAQKPVHLNESNAVRTLDPEAILFIKAEGDYSRIQAEDGPQPLERRVSRLGSHNSHASGFYGCIKVI